EALAKLAAPRRAARHRGARARAHPPRRGGAAALQRAARLSRLLPHAGRRALGNAARRGAAKDRRHADPARVSSEGDLRGWLDEFVRDSTFLERHPYYAHVLARITPVADPSVPAMGLSLHGGR